jgi:transposase
MEERVCQGCLALRAENQRLRQLLEEAQRAGKRQAAPFSKGQQKRKPKKPGRKPGDDYGTKAHRPPPPPEHIDEVHQAPLPDTCPDCGSKRGQARMALTYATRLFPSKCCLSSSRGRVRRSYSLGRRFTARGSTRSRRSGFTLSRRSGRPGCVWVSQPSASAKLIRSTGTCWRWAATCITVRTRL